MKKNWKPLIGLFVFIIGSTLTVGCRDATTGGRVTTHRAEFVVVGGGGAGFSTGVMLALAGRDVVVIEQAEMTGGNTATAGSVVSAPNPHRQLLLDMAPLEVAYIENVLTMNFAHPLVRQWQNTLRTEWAAHRAGPNRDRLFDSPSLHKLQTFVEGDQIGLPELIDHLDGALDALKWIEDLGAVWLNDAGGGGGGGQATRTPVAGPILGPGQITAIIGSMWRRAHTADVRNFPGRNGNNFFMPQEREFLRVDGRLFLEHKADTIILDEGRAVGVSGTIAGGGRFEALASKAVIIATGGFGANPDMLEAHNPRGRHGPGSEITGRGWINEGKWPDLSDPRVGHTNRPWIDGSGLMMAARAGANLVNMEQVQLLAFGAVPGQVLDNTIFISHEGRRYVNETGRRDETAVAAFRVLGTFDLPPGAPRTGRFFAFGNLSEGVNRAALPNDQFVGTTAQIGNWVHPADASAAAAFTANLNGAITAFNASRLGAADAFGRQVFDQPLAGPDFFINARVSGPVVHHTMGGIDVDRDFRVISVTGPVIPQLYAVGEAIGVFHGTNRLGSNAITEVITLGRRLGEMLNDKY